VFYIGPEDIGVWNDNLTDKARQVKDRGAVEIGRLPRWTENGADALIEFGLGVECFYGLKDTVPNQVFVQEIGAVKGISADFTRGPDPFEAWVSRFDIPFQVRFFGHVPRLHQSYAETLLIAKPFLNRKRYSLLEISGPFFHKDKSFFRD